MERSETVEEYILESGNWQESLNLLRDIFVSSGLKESIKWGVPVYVYEGKNIAGIAAFKSYVGIWFYQGALLKDKMKKLINASEGVTRAQRQWRFGSMDEIVEHAGLIRQYLLEAIENQKRGREIKPELNKPLMIPEELKRSFERDVALRAAYERFTLTRKREFADYVADAKREETRMKRLDRIIPMILAGVGLNDKYRGAGQRDK